MKKPTTADMMTGLPKAALLVLVFLTMTVLPAVGADRSPFEEPAAPENIYNYKRAAARITITGLIAMDSDAKVILKLNPEEPGTVFSVDSQITVSWAGIDHEFRIVEIGSRKIRLKGANRRNYEVEVK